MKYIPETYEDIYKLCTWYMAGDITADDYYRAVNEYSKIMVDRELDYDRAMQRNKNLTYLCERAERGVYTEKKKWWR